MDSLARELTPREDVEVNVRPAEDLLLVVVASPNLHWFLWCLQPKPALFGLLGWVSP